MDKHEEAINLLASLLAIQFTLDPYEELCDRENLYERGIAYDETAERCKLHMNLELIKLLNEGCTDDEVLEMINDMYVEGMECLSLDKIEYVREETKKLVMKRKERFENE